MTFEEKIEKLYDLVTSERGRKAIDDWWKENQEYDDGHRDEGDRVSFTKNTCLVVEFGAIFREFMKEVGLTLDEEVAIDNVLSMAEHLLRLCCTDEKEEEGDEKDA